jgi:hypothetical protein
VELVPLLLKTLQMLFPLTQLFGKALDLGLEITHELQARFRTGPRARGDRGGLLLDGDVLRYR